MRVRVFLVEDLVHVRGEIAAVLSSDRVEIAAAVGRVDEALGCLSRGLPFDVALVDLGLEDGDGAEILAAIARTRPEATAIALTVFDDGATVQRALAAGASGYVLKSASPQALIEAVLSAAAGGAPFTPAVARWLLDAYRARATTDRSVPPLARELTPRELEVVSLLCDGHSYEGVARSLSLSLGTVQSYVRTIYAKLRVSSKVELANLAHARGLR